MQADCAVEVDTNAYSVPWRLIGERVQVTVADGWVRVFHAGREVAAHPEAAGRHRARSSSRRTSRACPASGGRSASPARHRRQPAAEPDLLRPLAEYERAVGGGW